MFRAVQEGEKGTSAGDLVESSMKGGNRNPTSSERMKLLRHIVHGVFYSIASLNFERVPD